MENQIEQILGTAMTKLKTAVDADTIVGEPVEIGDGNIVVPVSRISFGFLAGGGEYGDGKQPAKHIGPSQFAGGSGGAVSVTPIGFLIARGGNVRVAAMNEGGGGNKLFGLAGDILARLTRKKK